MPITAQRKRFDIVSLRRRICREDYFTFIQEFWGEIVADDPVWNWHIRVMADEFQKVAETMMAKKAKEYDLIVNVPPGTSKSTVFSIMSCPWLWTRMPSCRFLGVSFGHDLSLDFANKARRLIKSKKYQETFPGIEISGDQDNKGYYANTMKGERRSTSIGADIIGRHSHIQVVDDPINPQVIRSALELENARIYLEETLPTRCTNQLITPRPMVMQRIGLEDPTGLRLRKKNQIIPVRHICLPARVSDNVKPAVFKNKYKGGLLDPVRLSEKVLQIKFEELKAFGFAGQYDQVPVPLTGGMFQVDKFRIIRQPRNLLEFTKVIRWWDKAATQDGGKYTAGVLMGYREHPRSPVVVLDVIRVQLESFGREQLIKNTSFRDKILFGDKYKVGLEQEPGSGGVDSTQATIRNLAGISVIFERPTGDKEERASAYSSFVNGGFVALVAADWNEDYKEELQHFSNISKYQDQTDASSGAFKYVTAKRIIVGAGGF